jgi:hypothetical protein
MHGGAMNPVRKALIARGGGSRARDIALSLNRPKHNTYPNFNDIKNTVKCCCTGDDAVALQGSFVRAKKQAPLWSASWSSDTRIARTIRTPAYVSGELQSTTMVEDVVAATEVLITQRAKVHRHVPHS